MSQRPAHPAGAYEGCLATATRLLDRVVMQTYDDALRPYEIKSTQLSLLVFVNAMRVPGVGPTAADLAPRMRIDQTTLSRNLDALAKRGLVELNDAPADGRARIVTLTPKGRALLKKALPAWQASQTRIREALGARLAEQITRAADRLSAGG